MHGHTVGEGDGVGLSQQYVPLRVRSDVCFSHLETEQNLRRIRLPHSDLAARPRLDPNRQRQGHRLGAVVGRRVGITGDGMAKGTQHFSEGRRLAGTLATRSEQVRSDTSTSARIQVSRQAPFERQSTGLKSVQQTVLSLQSSFTSPPLSLQTKSGRHAPLRRKFPCLAMHGAD
eukprot:GFKZ01005142.1.p2 GENE.GFKZ01005142.1~~GFKZ01005142.1.p2  ORF type:complete len:174 (-),score=9.84 GFKZ01005142.1:1067-1588(-)